MTDHGLEEEKNTRGRNLSLRAFCKFWVLIIFLKAVTCI